MIKITKVHIEQKEQGVLSSISFGKTIISKGNKEALIDLSNLGDVNTSRALSVSMFAKKASVSPQAVRKMISEGRLKAQRIGEQYVIAEKELDRYLNEK